MIYIIAFVITLSFIYGYKKYNTILNPLSITSVVLYGFFTILSYFSTVLLRAETVNFPLNYLEYAIAVSTIALLSYTFAFVLKLGFIAKFLTKILNKISRNNSTYQSLSFSGFIVLTFVCLGSFLFLVLFSDGGILWLTDPREAYLYHRSSNGVYYIFYLYSLLILYFYVIYMLRPKFLGLLLITAIFLFFSLYSGKKAFTLLFIIIACLYYNFNIKALGFKILLFYATITLIFLSFLIYLGSNNENINFKILLEYFNYADISSEFLYRYDEFGYYFGKAFFTSLWVLVPRSLYPDKPFEYGASLVHAIIYPGVAESGHTTGYFMWLSSYLDFGIFGVVLSFYLQGWLSRVIYEWYLSSRDTLFSFVLMVHFCLFEVWFFLPGVFAFVMCLFLLIISSIFSKKFPPRLIIYK